MSQRIIQNLDTESYEDLRKVYKRCFSLNYLGKDISNKLLLISLVGRLTYILKLKKPDWTHWKTLYTINKNLLPDNILKGICIVCEDFAYGCEEFPVNNIPDKEIPAKIKELLNNYMPF